MDKIKNVILGIVGTIGIMAIFIILLIVDIKLYQKSNNEWKENVVFIESEIIRSELIGVSNSYYHYELDVEYYLNNEILVKTFTLKEIKNNHYNIGDIYEFYINSEQDVVSGSASKGGYVFAGIFIVLISFSVLSYFIYCMVQRTKSNLGDSRFSNGSFTRFDGDGDEYHCYTGEVLKIAGKAYKHGNGIEYNKYEDIVYEGNFKYYEEENESYYEGKGCLYEDEELIYEGEFIKGKYHGKGSLYKDEELIYKGEFFEGKYHGNGSLYVDEELIYKGEFKDDKYHGKGCLYDDEELIYEGEFKDDNYHGKGCLYEDEVLIYEGEFNNGKRILSAYNVEKLISKLNSLIGLENVKKEVIELINFVKVQTLRSENNLNKIPISNHLVFTGNPGTGKTTVARLLGEIYSELGFLSKGHFIEVDRASLVAGYVGQTALKVDELIEEAIGGILFIDEAYSLTSKYSNDYGNEAIDCLLKRMEDYREDLIVIVAGYEEPMNDFLNSNPGFKSRFNKFINFENYQIDNLLEIFNYICNEYNYVYDKKFLHELTTILNKINVNEKNFSNGRYIRNLFEKLVFIQSSRISKTTNISLKKLTEFKLVDLEIFKNEK